MERDCDTTMIEKAKKLAGKCPVCGKTHPLITREVYIANDATERLTAYIRQAGGVCIVVCDENTEKYARVIADGADCLTFTLPGGAHATEITTAALRDFAVDLHPTLLVACGSGSIHDTVRYFANMEKIPFISYPTAASVDGFLSGVAAMTWFGQKLSFPAVPPIALFADERVYAEAPSRLTASGAADILGKYTALADWRIAQILTGEHLCERIYSLEKEALDETAYAIRHRSEYDDVAYARLVMNGLILSGLAMQLQENSRPASGAEHHMSHFWEMHLLNPESDGLHGEQVGVGLLAVLDAYKQFAERPTLLSDAFLHPDIARVMERNRLEHVFGELTDGIIHENMPAGEMSFSLTRLAVTDTAAAESAVRAVIEELPTVQKATELLQLTGAPSTLAELHLPQDTDLCERSKEFAPYVRNRLSLLKLIAAESVTLSR